MNRRSFLSGLIALAAPAIIRTPGLLMPIQPLRLVHISNERFFPIEYKPISEGFKVIIEALAVNQRQLSQYDDLFSGYRVTVGPTYVR